MWTDPKTKEKITVRELKARYHIEGEISVPYKNGEPQFDKYSIFKTKVEYKNDYVYSGKGGLKDLHNSANEKLAKEINKDNLNPQINDPIVAMRDYIENAANDGKRVKGCRNTLHEARDGETIYVVPDFINSIFTHNGGRSIAAVVQ